ncbi:MAG: VCBS repeat-containing protein [Chryseolinea sp.]
MVNKQTNNKSHHTRIKGLLIIAALITTLNCFGQTNPGASLMFEKQFVSNEAFESVGVADIDKDGQLDLISGSFWYKGPAFIERYFTGPVQRYAEYYDDFSEIILDVNQDTWPDVITGGWFGEKLVWRQNPGKDAAWEEHLIARTGNIECTRGWDMDNDGIPEIVPNTPGKPLVVYKLLKSEPGKVKFDSIRIFDVQGHGLGYGDINGDGRKDFIVDQGWLECPIDPFKGKWILHPDFNVKQASVPMIVADVNKDGIADVIIGQGHDYGLYWFEQRVDKKNVSTWTRHTMDAYNSQFHTMEWEDIDNDGAPELITGKRYRAHNDHDPGPHDPIGLYYFKWNGENFSKQVIAYGTLGVGKGTGIYTQIVDLDKNGWKDIVVAGKDGLCIFYNKGMSK